MGNKRLCHPWPGKRQKILWNIVSGFSCRAPSAPVPFVEGAETQERLLYKGKRVAVSLADYAVLRHQYTFFCDLTA
jgi:hypothetical protein